MTENHYKEQFSFEKRKTESERIRVKYPDRIPIVIQKANDSKLPDIDKSKYLVPQDLSAGQFIYVIRKRIKLTPEQAVFVFVGNMLLPTNELMSQVYAKHRDEDGYLYMFYKEEEVFGKNF